MTHYQKQIRSSITAAVYMLIVLSSAITALVVNAAVAPNLFFIVAGIFLAFLMLMCASWLAVITHEKLDELSIEKPSQPRIDFAFAAMCAWEWVLETLDRDDDYLDNRQEIVKLLTEAIAEEGICQIRYAVIQLLPSMEEAYAEAVEEGFDEPYDWEFVPHFMQYGVDWSTISALPNYTYPKNFYQ